MRQEKNLRFLKTQDSSVVVYLPIKIGHNSHHGYSWLHRKSNCDVNETLKVKNVCKNSKF